MARILIAGFCAVPGPDRPGVQMLHVVRALDRGHTVDVLVKRRDDQAYVERMAGGRILRVPMPDSGRRGQIDAFRRALRRQLEGAEYDVVHFRDGWSGIPVLELRDRMGYAAVFDVARSPMAQPQIMDIETAREQARDEEACLRGADLILAPTEPGRRALAMRAGPERVHLVGPGVDVDQFDWEEDPGGRPVVLYLGTLAPGHGSRILLRAMVEVCRRINARVVFAGPTQRELRDSLLEGIGHLGLRGKVRLIGEVQHRDVPALIARATVCVCPTAVELGPQAMALYPTRILEFMACRRAVIAPRRSTVTQLMEDGNHGLLFTPGDPIDLAEKITALLGDPALRMRLARSGYQLVRHLHTASRTRRSLRAAYAALPQASTWSEHAPRDQAGAGAAPEIPVSDITEALEVDDLHEHTDEQPRLPVHDLTAVDVGAPVPGDADRTARWIDHGTEPHVRADSWETPAAGRLVGEHTETTEALADDDGTPVDVHTAPLATPPVECRFAAGELEVPSPRTEKLEVPSPRGAALDREAPFVLLDGSDPDGASD